MDAYVVQMKIINENQLRDLELATGFIEFVQERQEKREHWSCHELCRAFIRQRPVCAWEVQDGYFGREGFQHCWLEGRSTDREESVAILDIYPIAGVRPQLVSSTQSPWDSLYMNRARIYSPDRMHGFILGAEKICEQLRNDHTWAGIRQAAYDMKFAP